jgi:hypothetical protein
MDAVVSLRAQGCAGGVTVEDVQYVFEEDNAIFARLESALGRKAIGAKRGRP